MFSERVKTLWRTRKDFARIDRATGAKGLALLTGTAQAHPGGAGVLCKRYASTTLVTPGFLDMLLAQGQILWPEHHAFHVALEAERGAQEPERVKRFRVPDRDRRLVLRDRFMRHGVSRVTAWRVAQRMVGAGL